jgi:hypothetical protein
MEANSSGSPTTGESDHQWSFLTAKFYKLQNPGESSLNFVCVMCQPKKNTVKASVNSMWNLKSHTKRIHPHSLDELEKLFAKNLRLKRKSTNESFGNASKKQGTIDAFVNLSSTSSHTQGITNSFITQNTLNKKIKKFVVNHMQDFAVVEDGDFIDIITSIAPTKKVIGRKTLMSQLKEDFETLKTNMFEEFATVDYVSITADLWSVASKSFLGVTVHYLAQNLQRKSFALACKRVIGSHTFDVLAKELENILEDFNIIHKTVGCTTDNGSNFVKSFQVFGVDNNQSSALRQETFGEEDEEDGENEDEESLVFTCLDTILSKSNTLPEESELEEDQLYHLPTHFRCASHTLNLVASKDTEAAMKDPMFKKIFRLVLTKCTALWNKQSRSSVAADTIRARCRLMFVVPNLTRWNSQFDAFQRMQRLLSESDDNLHALFRDLDLPKLQPSEVSFITEFVEVLRPLTRALDILQGEQNTHLGYLLPTISVLKELVQSQEGKTVYCNPLIKSIIAGIDKRFGKCFLDEKFIVASISHPKFKFKWIKNDLQRESHKNILKRELDHLIRNDCINQSGHSEYERESDTSAVDFFSGFLESDSTSKCSKFDSGIIIQQYLSNVKTVEDLNSEMFAPLKKIFTKFNTTLPSSASVERLFSKASGIYRKKRHNMSDGNFERQLLLKVNNFYST